MKEANQKRILGIVGSPRRGGNTEILIDEVLAGAEESGFLIEKLILNELNITPCQACNACNKTGDCVQKDDMQKILEKMNQSDVWVFGTPIYWWGPTAQFKAFIDRWYGADKAIFEKKKIILVISLGAGSAHYARHTIGMFEDIIPYKSAELVETILALGMNERGAVKKRPKIMAQARNAWKNC